MLGGGVSLYHLYKYFLFCERILKILPHYFPLFPVPPYKPNKGDDGAGATDGVGDGLGEGESFWSDADVGGADQGHEQGGEQSDVEVFAVTHQIDRDGPKGEDRECLVAPRKVTPDNLKAFRVAEAKNEHTNGEQEQRNTY